LAQKERFYIIKHNLLKVGNNAAVLPCAGNFAAGTAAPWLGGKENLRK